MTSAANDVQLVHHGVDGFFNSRISPRTSTVIFRDRSPYATAVVTSAMLRTWSVRLPAMEFTLSVKSFQVPATPRTIRLTTKLTFGADFAGDARDFGSEAVELVDHGVDGVLQLQNFTAHVHGDFAGKVAARHGGRDLGNVADLRGEVPGHGVHVIRQIFPSAGDTGHLGLTAELTFGADFARTRVTSEAKDRS